MDVSSIQYRSRAGDHGRRRGSDQHLEVLRRRPAISLKIHLLLWAAIAALVVPFVSWALDSTEPFIFIGGSLVPDSGAPGARVTAYYRIDSRRPDDNCTMLVQRSWIDSGGIEWTMPPVKLKYDNGFKDIALTLNIPMDARPGRLLLNSDIEWSCNPLQRVFPRHTEMPTLGTWVQR